MTEEIKTDVGRRCYFVFDVGPFNNALFEHIFYRCPPIPTGATVWQHAGISGGICNACVLVNKIVVTKHALIQDLNLIYGCKNGQWQCVLIMAVASAPNRVNLNGTVYFGCLQLLHGLFWLGRFVEGSIDASFKNAGKWVFLEGRQAF